LANSEEVDTDRLTIQRASKPKKCFKKLSQNDLKKVTFTIMGQRSDHTGRDDTPIAQPGCFDGSGKLKNGMIHLDEVVLKDYRMSVLPSSRTRKDHSGGVTPLA
jgi:hypothetical protein